MRRKNNDVIFANERPLKDENGTVALIEEARHARVQEQGHRRDPLVRIERLQIYQILKKEFGEKIPYTPVHDP